MTEHILADILQEIYGFQVTKATEVLNEMGADVVFAITNRRANNKWYPVTKTALKSQPNLLSRIKAVLTDFQNWAN